MTLKEYLKQHNETVGAFQKRSGIGHPKGYEYISGKYRPREGNMRKIMEATDGLVTANDFFCHEVTAAP